MTVTSSVKFGGVTASGVYCKSFYHFVSKYETKVAVWGGFHKGISTGTQVHRFNKNKFVRTLKQEIGELLDLVKHTP